MRDNHVSFLSVNGEFMSNFRPINRDTGFLLPPSVDEWLPQRHLARFVVEVIDGLDLSQLVKAYRGSGIASYHPAMLLGLLVYGYATKVFSSRAIERAPARLGGVSFYRRQRASRSRHDRGLSQALSAPDRDAVCRGTEACG